MSPSHRERILPLTLKGVAWSNQTNTRESFIRAFLLKACVCVCIGVQKGEHIICIKTGKQ